MSGERNLQPNPVAVVADAFKSAGVDYLFLGKTGAILLGYPGLTQHLVVFPEPSELNCQRIISGLEKLGLSVEEALKTEILGSKDFVQIKTGPFDFDLVFAPDGISSFAEARARRVMHGDFPIASLDDIIASKRASGREKDLIELPLLEDFRLEYERLHPRPLKNAWEIQRHQP